MTPYEFFVLTLGLTAAATAANLIHRRRRHRALQELARVWRMHYSPRDVFRLAEQLAPRLPLVGAANISVADVVYGIEGEFHRYIFSIEYTLGVVRAKRRELRVATFCEPRSRSGYYGESQLLIADAAGSLLDQYRALGEPIVAARPPHGQED